jgi:hypothetical protein
MSVRQVCTESSPFEVNACFSSGKDAIQTEDLELTDRRFEDDEMSTA